MKKRGPAKQYVSEQERNRQKQKRHRDKINSVTLTATSEGLTRTLRAADHCIKCNNLTLRYHRPTVCPAHQNLVDAALAKLGLSANRATHLNTKDIVTGTNIARVSDARSVGHGHGGREHGFTDNGKAIAPGRFTARADMLPDVLEIQGVSGPWLEELIKAILPWFTERVQWLTAETIRLNPYCHHEADVANIVRIEAIEMLNAELAKPKEQRAWS
jgi:hypothetical protein